MLQRNKDSCGDIFKHRLTEREIDDYVGGRKVRGDVTLRVWEVGVRSSLRE